MSYEVSPENYSNLIKKLDGHPQISFDNTTPTPDLIKRADIICTINSTVGIEGLIKQKKVVTLGQAFYNIEGLVHHAKNTHQLNEIFRTIDTLSINHNLVEKFLDYMINDYQISGSWETPNEDHFKKLTLKIKSFLNKISD